MSERIELDITLPKETRYLGLVGQIGESMARTLERFTGDREELAYHINLVLTEAMANAIKHAREPESTEVRITITLNRQKLTIKVYDRGQGFDLCNLAPPDTACLQDHGRGIFIIRTIMDRVAYRKLKGGHVLEMEKTLH
jgi:serine/threonine-protein kinase RsbW